jgi:hypothetical protein
VERGRDKRLGDVCIVSIPPEVRLVSLQTVSIGYPFFKGSLIIIDATPLKLTYITAKYTRKTARTRRSKE